MLFCIFEMYHTFAEPTRHIARYYVSHNFNLQLSYHTV